MAIIKDVTVKINNGTATLDTPVQFYEKDHDVELRFRLMDYKYKYDKDPQNILNSVDEDVLEAYTTIVNPRGYELEQINGVVKNDIVIFRLDPTYTDELDELGTYKLQIHIKCTHSEFTIPPITFEVLQRLKGIKVVTDGEDEVDNSEILDNSSKFVSDETGKLIIEWKKGDMISSAKLNAMVDVINDAVDEEKIRQENEIEREKKANNKIQELENTRVEYVNKFDDELDSFADQVDTTMSDYETRFNALTVSQQQDAEIIDARDGEQTLRARLDRDIQKPSIIYEEVEGSYINVDTTCGYAKNVEIIGNTIQNQNDLADIRSVGDKVENQELYEIPVLSTGKNLFNIADYDVMESYNTTFNYDVTNNAYTLTYSGTYPNIVFDLTKHLYIFEGKEIISSCKFLNSNSSAKNSIYLEGVDSNGKKIYFNSTNGYKIPKNTLSKLCLKILPNNTTVNLSGVCEIENIQLELGAVATPYEPYQGDKLTILSPTPLEKVGDVADRIICKDGVWGVEKNIEKIILPINTWYEYGSSSNAGTPYILFMSEFKGIVRGEHLICNEFECVNILNRTNEGIYSIGSDYLYISILRSRLNEENEASFLTWMKDNEPYVLKKSTQPTFIPLPHSQQIALRTFANKTNISFGCEIEPTLKASVPKSISATVSTHTEQIDNLGKEIDKIKKLEESTASTVTTESDFTTVTGTSNGYFEDVKLEGKTLVNLCKNGTGKTINSSDENYNVSFNDLSIGKTYTLIINQSLASGEGVRIGLVNVYGNEWVKTDFYIDYTRDNEIIQTFTFTDSAISELRIQAKGTVGNTSATSDHIIRYVILLEGDHTQNPPSFFEGIKSVGQDADEISVLSTNNRCYDNTFVLGMLSSSTGDVITSSNDWCSLKNYINVKPSGKYFVSLENADNIAPTIGVFFYNNSYLSMININNNDYITIPSNANAIKIRYQKLEGTTNNIYNFNILISENDTKSKQDKKRILYYNDETQAWEKPILRQWDSIEKHSDGKYYYHKRSGEVVLNGSEDWSKASDFADTIRFYHNPTLKHKTQGLCISDKFNVLGSGNITNTEGIVIGGSYGINIEINKSKLSTQDAAGFKQWLQANPATVVYQLAEEKVYECTDLDLITYQNETNLMVKGGAIVPKTTLKVHKNIANIATILQEKVNLLENNVGHVNNAIGNINSDLTSLTESIEGSSVSVVSKDGYLKDIEILGNTVQDQDNLADIRSVGDKLENQELYEIPVLSTNGLDSSDSNYKEHKLTILSPVQLEKVGDATDRIVYNEELQTWGVEKNINSKFLTGANIAKSNWQKNENTTGCLFKYEDEYLAGAKEIKVISSIVPSKTYLEIYNKDIEGICLYETNMYGVVLKISNSTLNGFTQVEYFNQNPLYVKYQLAQPTFIPLPYDQQVKLRTFANKTNISFGCEIEPTLKASVPKSLSSTVSTHTEQIDNLGKELDKVKKLEESTVSTVTTESDFTTVEQTSNGYFEDVKLKGRTLVNLIDNTHVHSSMGMKWYGILKAYNNKKVTVFIRVKNEDTTNMKAAIYRHKSDGASAGPFMQYSNSYINKPFVADFSTDSATDFTDYIVYIHNHDGKAYLPMNNDNIYTMVLEGDHTQNPPSFFEGLKSVGQEVDEISVLSCNENLFDVKSVIEKYPSVLTPFGNGLSAINGVYNLTYLIPDANKQYTISWHGELVTQSASNAYIGFAFAYTDGTSEVVIGLGDKNISSTKGKTIKEFKITYSNTCTMNLTNISLVQGDTPKPYQPHKQDKKPLLYYNPTTDTWEKPVLREWDSIEKHADGKYYYHKRSGEVVLNGSEDWKVDGYATANPNTQIFSTSINDKAVGITNVICDKFLIYDYCHANDIESMAGFSNANSIRIRISNSKLISQDAQGFKTWLQANPTTVVYQLAEEKVYECTDIDLITYQNETNLMVKGGAIVPKTTLKVMCNITNVVRELQQKVSNLENYIQHVMIDALNNALNE